MRRATTDDVPRLAELCREALDELRPTRGGAVFAAREGKAEPFEDTLHAELADPTTMLWAGTLDEHIVGYAVARVEQLRDGTRLGVVTDIYVLPEAREVGVGEVLIDAVVEWATAERCDGIDAWALPGNRETKNFFEGAGFSARLLVMHRRAR